MRVLMATGVEEMDKGIASELAKKKVEVVGECYYREALLSLAQQKRPDAVIVSPHLPGSKDFLDLIKDMRMAGFRLILLPGRRDEDEAVKLARRAAALGVYDILWDPVSPAAAVKRVLKPATLAEAGVEPEGEVSVNTEESGKRNRKDKKESVYVVFGESTEKVSNYLESRGYRIVGEDRSLDAAAIMALNLDEIPDTYLVLGSTSVCGVVDVGIDYGEALLDGLRKLKEAAPDSRIVLILPESVEPEVYQKILYMGVYDVYKTGSVSMERLPEMLSARKDIKDSGLNTLPVPRKAGGTEVVPKGNDVAGKGIRQSIVRLLSALHECIYRRAEKERVQKKKVFGGVAPGIIVGNNYIRGNWSSPAEIDADCDAVVIPASWGIGAVREFRRNSRFRAVPLIVLKGNKDFLRAGADMCVKRLSPKVIEEATALARRYKELWQRAETDSLTGLYKKEFLLNWIAEQERRPEPNFSIAIIDIDHFKSFNDTYGHQAGDAVLASFGAFLKFQTRVTDVAARYGGEEFVIGLPNTSAAGARVLIDRLREEWARREIVLPSGEKVRCTFSAGVAEYEKGKDVIAEADKFLYKAKSEGRNRVVGAPSRRPKVLLLGQRVSFLSSLLLEQGIEAVADPADAAAVVADVQGFSFAPAGKPLVVLGTGTIADFAVKKSRPDAKVVKDPESVVSALVELLEKPKPQRNLKVLPGGRSSKGQSLALHSALYIVCPSRPGQAGEVAARIARSTDDCALVCAAPESTAALVLGISERELITSDWRIPGSNAPLRWGGITVWPVDPLKFLNVRDVSPNALVESIKPKFALVVVDCAGSLDIAGRASRTDGIIVLHREGDSADAATGYWIQSYPGNNVLVCTPSEAPDILPAENGFVLVKRGIGALEKGSLR